MLGLAPPATAAAWPVAAFAHSIGDVASRLHDREPFFQPLEGRPAPDFALLDSQGLAVRLADLRGKVVVLHFIYASCPDVCPVHADRIAAIQGMVNQTPMRDQVHFVSITTDPVRDTPDIMQGFGAAHGLDASNWSFLTSGPERPEDTLRLARAYGLVFVPSPDGMQMHGVVTHVIDRQGRWRAKFHGLDVNPTNVVLYVNALTHDEDGEAQSESARPARRRSLWERLRSVF